MAAAWIDVVPIFFVVFSFFLLVGLFVMILKLLVG